MTNMTKLAGTAAALVLLCQIAAVQAGVKVTANASVSERIVRPGEVSVLAIELRVPDGYHLYSMTKIAGGPLPLKIEVKAEGVTPVTEWYGPKPHVEEDPNFQKAVELYNGVVVYRRGFRVTATVPGGLPIAIAVRGQICNDERCIMVQETLEVALTIETGPARSEKSAVPSLQGEDFPPNRPAPTPVKATSANAPPLGQGLLGFLLIAFLAGLGALVTPCVFPMIPITVSFFSKFAKVSLRRSVIMASIYAGSIVVTFTFVGVLVSALFGAVGMQSLSSSPAFNIFLTLLLVVFAFNLFGLFEIQMPSWLVNRSSQKEQSLTGNDGSLTHQAAGVFFMAITFTLVSFTCTVGFIGVVLAEASKGNWFFPALGMLAFSVAFSLPFFILAVFPSWAEKLQGKGGDWMVAVKVVLGFLELAGAFKFLSNVDLIWQWGVISRPLVLSVWVAIFTLAGLYLLRVFNLPHSDAETRRVGPIRMMFACGLFALSVYAAMGIRDQKRMGGWMDGWLPPAIYPGDTADDVVESGGHSKWIVNDIAKGMSRAKAENKPLFIDFTGYTCTNCRYMEGAVFPRPEVKQRLDRMVLVSAYTDCEQPVCERQRALQLARFDTAALPLYAIINPHGDTVLATHPDMSKSVRAYVGFLDAGLTAFEAVKPKI